MIIRAYRETDKDGVFRVWHAASLGENVFQAECMWNNGLDVSSEGSSVSSETYVADEHGNVVGFICLTGSTVSALFVLPDFRRQGIGAMLVEHVRGIRDDLRLDLLQENETGREFCRNRGFVEVSEGLHEDSGNIVVTLHDLQQTQESTEDTKPG